MATETESAVENENALPAGWEFTIEDYVRIEADSELVKHEFDNGQIRAMSGGTPEHARMAMALGGQLQQQLRGKPCAVYSSDLRIRVGGLITYPDLSIGCGKAYADLTDKHAQLNPCVLFEITSPSSVRYDRGKKRMRYFEIPSLREYVIVSHEERRVDVYAREVGGAWGGLSYEAGSRALIPSLGIEIIVDDLYFDPRPDED